MTNPIRTIQQELATLLSEIPNLTIDPEVLDMGIDPSGSMRGHILISMGSPKVTMGSSQQIGFVLEIAVATVGGSVDRQYASRQAEERVAALLHSGSANSIPGKLDTRNDVELITLESSSAFEDDGTMVRVVTAEIIAWTS